MQKLLVRAIVVLMAAATTVALIRLSSGIPGVWGEEDRSEGRRPRCEAYGVFSFPVSDVSLDALAGLGVGWARLQFRLGEIDSGNAVLVTQVFDRGVGLWLTLYHRDRTNISDTTGFDRSERGAFPPVDPVRYRQLVKEPLVILVDHLRGCGKDPAAWLVVQCCNEVLPSDVAPPTPRRFWHGTSDEYLRTLRLTVEAVKSVDPGIPVAVGGIASEAMEVLVSSAPATGWLRTLLERWQTRMLAAGAFQWADIHLYHEVESIPAKVQWVRTRWPGRLAATEIGGPDPATGAIYTEALHVRDLRLRMEAVRAAGIDRMFWTSLVETSSYPDPRFGPMALISITGRRKPAFGEYRKIIDTECPPLAAARSGPGS
ncbi:MAG: hypothetical protein HYX75_07405 [Acidobacteria bacterium]|nr:hypothetical protein [Acidobacteriota bacterium]